MFSPDLLEWLGLMVSLPFRLLAVFLCLVTVAYVYFDSERRSKSKLFATALAAAVWFGSWPISFFAYIACTVILDRRVAR